MLMFRNWFFGKSTTKSKSKSKTKGQSYDNTVAHDPPVKGSYPVAGNGPNVLEEIQRSKARRDSPRQPSIAAAPDVPRYREDIVERPRTAPNNGKLRGFGFDSLINGQSNGDVSGRTRSGFSMKTPPIFPSTSISTSRRNSLGAGRRNSLRANVEPPPLPTLQPVHTAKPKAKPPREIQTYQPKKGAEPKPHNGLPHHSRNNSRGSHKSYVDLLEAHSNINPSRETSRHRAKASGMRNYGEDVADRNMVSQEREPRLDLNSPEFSYMKTLYSPQRRPKIGTDGGHSRTSSALGHVLGHDAGSSDDIQPHHRHGKATSIRSAVTPPRPGVPYPPRNISPSLYSSTDDDRSTTSILPNERRGRALSPLSSTSMHDADMRETLRKSAPAPDRGRRTLRDPPLAVPAPKQSALPKAKQPGSASVPTVAPVPERQSAAVPRILKEPPPVAPPGEFPRITPPSDERRSSNSSAQQRQRAMSGASQGAVTAPSSHKSRGSYSAFPNTSTERSAPQSTTSRANKRARMLVEQRKEPISLEGVVDLTNTVDTNVTTKTLPAVTHEYVTPTLHEIREEQITREIHTHDVYHRVLPVIETEILPTKHYIPTEDGKGLVEIAEHELHKHNKHTVTGKPNGNWHVTIDNRITRGRTQSLTQSIYAHANINEDDGADAPTIGLVREPHPISRANSVKSLSKSKSILEPILASKKEYMTMAGYPKTEFIWRHPPVLEDARGRTQPVYIGAGLGDLSSPGDYYSDEEEEEEEEEDTAGAEFGAMRGPAKGEEELLFRDSGYGSQGMLPGLTEVSPTAGFQSTNDDVEECDDEIQYGKGKAADVADVQRGMDGLSVRR